MTLLKNEQLNYIPVDYSLADYYLYHYYLALQKALRQNRTSSDKYMPPLDKALEDLCALVFEMMKSASSNYDPVLNDIEALEAELKRPHGGDKLWCVLSKIVLLNLTTASQECKQIKQAFLNTLEEITLNNQNQPYPEPDEFSPVRRSFAALNFVWKSLCGTDLPFEQVKKDITENNTSNLERYLKSEAPNIADLHLKNLKIIFDRSYQNKCFESLQRYGVLIRNKKERDIQNAGETSVAISNSGFLLAVYSDPRFQSRYFQLLLLAIIITAALVAAAFLLKASLLPVAVATVVNGLAKYATHIIVGSVVVGTAAAITLMASLHARSFFNRPGNGGDKEGSSPSMEILRTPSNK